MTYDVEAEYYKIRDAVEALEVTTPDQMVMVLKTPPGVAVTPGRGVGPQTRAVLRSVTVKPGSRELWVNLGEGSARPTGTQPWSPETMRVAVTGVPRDVRQPVQFAVVGGSLLSQAHAHYGTLQREILALQQSEPDLAVCLELGAGGPQHLLAFGPNPAIVAVVLDQPKSEVRVTLQEGDSLAVTPVRWNPGRMAVCHVAGRLRAQGFGPVTFQIT
ncbi:hypothetical protein [Burkholderia gladioli]|uniref:hypothetical protein n=1 Tax=Burkholderia gladioli TaxID=28095 RepID=UPI0005C5783E|nr:hypothetical protein [Burkholderia gladioli]